MLVFFFKFNGWNVFFYRICRIRKANLIKIGWLFVGTKFLIQYLNECSVIECSCFCSCEGILDNPSLCDTIPKQDWHSFLYTYIPRLLHFLTETSRQWHWNFLTRVFLRRWGQHFSEALLTFIHVKQNLDTWQRIYCAGYPEFGYFLNKTNRPMVYSCSWPFYQIYSRIQVRRADLNNIQ